MIRPPRRWPLLRPVLALTLLSACSSTFCPSHTAEKRRDETTWCELRGTRHGPYEERSDGVLVAQGHYEHGEESGAWQWWRSDGTLHHEGTYAYGEPRGVWTWYDEDGNRAVTTVRDRAQPLELVWDRSSHPDPQVLGFTTFDDNVLQIVSVEGRHFAEVGDTLVSLDEPTSHFPLPPEDRQRRQFITQGLRTMTTPVGDDAVVVWLDDELPRYEVFQLNAEGRAFVHGNDFGVVYRDALGRLMDQPLDHRPPHEIPLDALELQLAGERLIVSTSDDRLVSYNRVQQTTVWSQPIAGLYHLEVVGWQYIVLRDAGDLEVRSFRDGSLLWRLPEEEIPLHRAKIIGDVVWVYDKAFDLATGTPLPHSHPAELYETEHGVTSLTHEVLTHWEGNVRQHPDLPRPTLRARLDGGRVTQTDDGRLWAFQGPRLVELAPVLAGPPQISRWEAPVLRGDATHGTVHHDVVRWSAPEVGALRLALHLPDDPPRRGETVIWLDLPQPTPPQTLTWPDAWSIDEHHGWSATTPNGWLWIGGERPPVAGEAIERPALLVDGMDWAWSDRIDLFAEARIGELSAALDALGPWTPRSLARGQWTGRSTLPWLTGPTVQPAGWTGWSHPTPQVEMQLANPYATEPPE